MKVTLSIALLIFVLQIATSQDMDEFDLKYFKNISEIQRNSLSLDYKFAYLTLLYERTVPILNNSALLFGAGICQDIMYNKYNRIPVYKAAFMFGRLIHYAEAGVALVPMQKNPGIVNPFMGYRFQSYKGFFFRVDVIFTKYNTEPLLLDGPEKQFHPTPGISAGYSF